MDKENGSKFGALTFEDWSWKTLDQGVATHTYAAFDEDLTGKCQVER